MIEISRTQDEEVGDGTTSVIILGMFTYYIPVCVVYHKDCVLICSWRDAFCS